MNRTIPRLASWLLRRFGVPERNESLMGDLEEEYCSGRSLAWIWKQTAVAILTTNARAVAQNKLLTLRAVAAGWLVLLNGLLVYAVFRPPATYPPSGFEKLIPYVFQAVLFAGIPWVSGWAVARLYPGERVAMVCTFAVSLLPLDAAVTAQVAVQTPAWAIVCYSIAPLAAALAGGLLPAAKTTPPPPAAPAEHRR